METKQRHQISIASDLAVIGHNPENADLDHPNGEVLGERFYLLATAPNGARYAYGWFDSASKAEAVIPFAPPIFLWDETRPEYGSVAYERYGADDDLLSEQRHNEAEAWGFDTRYMRF